MIESRCQCCGGRVLLPDPPARTKEEKVAMRKRWDAAVEEGQRRGAPPQPDEPEPVVRDFEDEGSK